MHVTNILFLVQFNNFHPDNGLLLELHALTQVACSYVLLHAVYTVDREIFICRNFRLLNFHRVIFSSLSTPTKIKRAEN